MDGPARPIAPARAAANMPKDADTAFVAGTERRLLVEVVYSTWTGNGRLRAIAFRNV